tara:strand:- start:1592 stop:1879 length:288 start_codon:yes stop_codon:yes gene_type:complete
MCARVARFYGWPDSEINIIPFKTLVKYYHAIEVLESGEMLAEMTSLDYVKHMKDRDRKDLHRRLLKNTKKHQDIEEKNASVDDLEALVKGLLSGR